MGARGGTGELSRCVMKVGGAALAVATLGLAACSTPAATTIVLTQSPGGHSAAAAASSARPEPAITKTVVSYRTAPVT